MSAASQAVEAKLDKYINTMSAIGKPISVLYIYPDQADKMNADMAKKFKKDNPKAKDSDCPKFTKYRGYPVEVVRA